MTNLRFKMFMHLGRKLFGKDFDTLFFVGIGNVMLSNLKDISKNLEPKKHRGRPRKNVNQEQKA